MICVAIIYLYIRLTGYLFLLQVVANETSDGEEEFGMNAAEGYAKDPQNTSGLGNLCEGFNVKSLLVRCIHGASVLIEDSADVKDLIQRPQNRPLTRMRVLQRVISEEQQRQHQQGNYNSAICDIKAGD